MEDRFETNEVEWPRTVETRRKKFWQWAKHSWLYSDLIKALKGEPLTASFAFSDEGILISASALTHFRKKAEERDKILKAETEYKTA